MCGCVGVMRLVLGKALNVSVCPQHLSSTDSLSTSTVQLLLYNFYCTVQLLLYSTSLYPRSSVSSFTAFDPGAVAVLHACMHLRVHASVTVLWVCGCAWSASCARWSECVLCEVWLVPSVFCTECVAGFRLQASAVVHSFVSHVYMLV